MLVSFNKVQNYGPEKFINLLIAIELLSSCRHSNLGLFDDTVCEFLIALYNGLSTPVGWLPVPANLIGEYRETCRQIVGN